MPETRKIAAILAADVVGFSRMTGADEDRTLARLRALRADLIDPTIASQNGRVFKRTGDGALVEFRSVVEAVRCAISVQNAMIERNVGLPVDQRIEFRIGIHLGDVVEENDGDLMGDGVNIAARLEGIATPGAICLSEDAYRQVRGRLDLEVTDLGPTQLKNIAEPVLAYLIEIDKPALATPAAPTAKRQSRLAQFAAVLCALVLLAGGIFYVLFGRHGAPAEAPHLSIVVLPFANLSNDADQDYFADGVTENLTTELSRIRDSFVIARNTAFTFKGKSVDARQIGSELGVRYVLEGSVQRDHGRVRVNARLIDAQSGAHLWADGFEEDVADLFKLQDEIVARLSTNLGLALYKAEAQKGAGSKNPDVIDLYMRAMALTYREYQEPMKDRRATNLAARALFERALKIDPDSPSALSGDAFTYYVERTFGWGSDETDYESRVLDQLNRAIALAPDNFRPYVPKSLYLLSTRRFNEALGAAETGLALDANSPPLYSARAGAEISLGRYDEAKADVQKALRLSPREPRIGYWHMQLGLAELGAGRVQGAIDELRKAMDADYRNVLSYTSLAAAYALQGDMEEAKSALGEARRQAPNLSMKWMNERFPPIPTVAEGLRKAGMPEE